MRNRADYDDNNILMEMLDMIKVGTQLIEEQMGYWMMIYNYCKY